MSAIHRSALRIRHLPSLCRAAFFLGAVCVCLVSLLTAQTSDQPWAASVNPVAAGFVPNLAQPAASDSYQLGPGDLISVSVYQMPEVTRLVRLNTDGTIRLPFIEKLINANGLTPPELASRIGEVLRSAGLARNPQVSVTVSQIMSKPIVISGAVQHPGVIQAAEPMTLLEALSRSGGLTQTPGKIAIVSKKVNQHEEIQRVDLDRLAQDPSPENDPLLRGGETVRVLTAARIYAVGDLQEPGAFPVPLGQQMSVLSALALAHGSKPHANLGKASILRLTPQGGRTQIAIRLDKILKHQAPDVELQAGDVLYIPSNTRAAVSAAALGFLGEGATMATGYAVGHVF